MIVEIRGLIKNAEKSMSECPKIDLVSDRIISSIENLFYGNLITNFEDNLNQENLEEFKISKEEYKKIVVNFKKLFNETKKALENTEGIGEDNYLQFKEDLAKISSGGSKFLLEIEKALDYSDCKEEISEFKAKIKNLGKTINLKKEVRDGKTSVSLGYE